jgi:branched-chain amino acid aminotransferase
VLALGAELGLEVQERKITIDEWRSANESGALKEVFACGTAAVITPLSALKSNQGEMVFPVSSESDSVWGRIRASLLGVQTGTVEDTHGWLTRLL